MKTIPLTKGYVALVDDEDFERVSKFKWQAHPSNGLWYAHRTQRIGPRCENKKLSIFMHRFLLDVTDPSIKVDHRNHDGFDNRRSNLRLCSQSQNLGNQRPRANSSGFKGVRWCPKSRKWSAEITANKQYEYLGLFLTPEAAAHAYNMAAVRKFGEFACLNG